MDTPYQLQVFPFKIQDTPKISTNDDNAVIEKKVARYWKKMARYSYRTIRAQKNDTWRTLFIILISFIFHYSHFIHFLILFNPLHLTIPNTIKPKHPNNNYAYPFNHASSSNNKHAYPYKSSTVDIKACDTTHNTPQVHKPRRQEKAHLLLSPWVSCP